MTYARVNEPPPQQAPFDQEITSRTYYKEHQHKVAPVMCTEEDLEMEQEIKRRIIYSNPMFARAKSEMGTGLNNLLSRRRKLNK